METINLTAAIRSGALRIIKDLEEEHMDIAKFIAAILSGFAAYSAAAKDKEITINEAMGIASTVIRDSGLGDQKFAALKK